MRIIKLGALTLILCLLLVGCADSKVGDSKSYKSNRIEDVAGNQITTTEYVDESTKVHYLIVQEYQNTISVTPMYNADGTLKTSK